MKGRRTECLTLMYNPFWPSIVATPWACGLRAGESSTTRDEGQEAYLCPEAALAQHPSHLIPHLSPASPGPLCTVWALDPWQWGGHRVQPREWHSPAPALDLEVRYVASEGRTCMCGVSLGHGPITTWFRKNFHIRQSHRLAGEIGVCENSS